MKQHPAHCRHCWFTQLSTIRLALDLLERRTGLSPHQRRLTQAALHATIRLADELKETQIPVAAGADRGGSSQEASNGTR